MKSLNIKFLLAAAIMVIGVSISRAQTVLDDYIKVGLESNVTLQQKNISLKQAEQSLQIARSYFLPSVTLLGDYAHGKGGRSIQLPIGDLLNPVYASLNQLTQSDEFPEVENVEQNFFPRNFYDARIRTSVPLVNTDIIIGNKIQSQQMMLKTYEAEVYKRELVLEIKTAYFNHLAAISAAKVYQSALDLVNRNHAVNESLLRNGKALPANSLRSKSEVERVKAELANAEANVSVSRKYFNFLLNRELNSEITVQDDFSMSAETDVTDISAREELNMLRSAIEIQESTVQLNKLARLPKVNAFFDFGSQASDWIVNTQSRYYLAGVQFNLPLFQGFRNNIQTKRATLDVKNSNLDLLNVSSQLQMAADVATLKLQTSQQNYQAATEQVKSARSYFNLIEKGYQQGVNSLIEYIDARNQLTSSELQLSVRQYELLIATAKLERETSSFNLPK